jgi:GxxExxY protein
MKHEETTHAIIGCAYAVYNELGYGYLESVYERALQIELTARQLPSESQAPVEVFYRSQAVGQFRCDLLVDRNVIVELKSVAQLMPVHEVQLVNYLVATGLDVGLLINFGPTGVEAKRKLRQLRQDQHPEETGLTGSTG